MMTFLPIEVKNNYGYEIQTESLPTDLNFMPTLGNGHLGYTVFGDAIYMNGIYNGAGGNSRRARIPNWLNISVSVIDKDDVVHEPQNKCYELNLREGFFRWQHTIPDLGLIIQERTYPHRYYNRTLVYELKVHRTETKDPLTLKLTQSPGPPSNDFTFTPWKIDEPKTRARKQVGNKPVLTIWKALKAVTKTKEHDVFQKELRTIYIYLSEDLENGKILKMAEGEYKHYYRLVLTADEDESKARHEITQVSFCDSVELIKSQRKEWKNLWHDFEIEIINNIELSQIINAGIFYIASSLPSLNSFQENGFFYGLSPTGLGRGGKTDDYLGHNMWDTEMWMLPVVGQLEIQWARELIFYRKQMYDAAEYNARFTNCKGSRYPWESAYTGIEVTQPKYPEIAAYEIHINADILLAAKHYYALTNDFRWFFHDVCRMLLGIADFIIHRCRWYPRTKNYHVRNVMGPDEYHSNINDSAYTNVSFRKAIEFASNNIVQGDRLPHPRWRNIMEKMYIPYDKKNDYHPEFWNYQIGEKVKQADVILLGYPLNLKMNDSTRLNDLKIYEAATDKDGPAMTWSMFAINFLDVNETEKADHYFEKSYKNYVRDEFKVWGEYNKGKDGAVNFLTGIGGFLQLIINGYAGIRFDHKDRRSTMEIRKSRKIPNTKGFQINGLYFVNHRFNLTIDETGATNLLCTKDGDLKLEVIFENKTQEVFKGLSIDLKGEPVLVQTIYLKRPEDNPK